MKDKIKLPLKKALFVLLYDHFESTDMELEMSDDSYVNYIIYALIEANDDTCPFKNYGSICNCDKRLEVCEDGLSITCGQEPDTVWRKFISGD